MNEARKFLRGFRYAYEGIVYSLSSQRNMKFHFMIAFLVLVLALLLNVSKLEILFVLLAVTLVIVTELINTAVEKTVDLAMPDRHPTAKIAKDVAAAAVLVSAVFAVAVGMIVFYEPISLFFQHGRSDSRHITAGKLWIFLSLVLFAVIVIHARFSKYSGSFRPSLLTAVAFSISTLMSLYTDATFIILLSYLLSIMIAVILYEKTTRSFPSLMLGGIIGTVITIAAFQLM